MALGLTLVWPVGLPLSIASWIRSARAQAPSKLGIVGTLLNMMAIPGSIAAVAVFQMVVLNGLIPLILAAGGESGHLTPGYVPHSPPAVESTPTQEDIVRGSSGDEDGDGVVSFDERFVFLTTHSTYWVFSKEKDGWRPAQVDGEEPDTLVDVEESSTFVNDSTGAQFTVCRGEDPTLTSATGEEASRQALATLVGRSVTDPALQWSSTTVSQLIRFERVELVVAEYSDGAVQTWAAARAFDDGSYLAIYRSGDAADWDADDQVALMEGLWIDDFGARS